MRQSKALARLAKSKERELNLRRAEAVREHEENEQLIAEIRQLHSLAPSPQRRHRDHIRALEPRLFPPLGRSEEDERECQARCAEAARTLSARGQTLQRCLVWAGVLLTAGGAASGLALHPAGWAAVPLGAATLFGAWRLAGKVRAARETELRERNEAIATEIAERLERGRRQHAIDETARRDRLKKLLAGDESVCEKIYGHAADHLELPLNAMPLVEMLSPAAAEIQVSLHAASEIPTQSSRLLKSGRISYRNRSQKLVREDDTRAMCSLCLLAAALAFDELPSLEVAVVSGYRDGIDRATGKDADLCYVAAVFDRDSVAELRLDRVDPIAALRALELHRLHATKTFILKPVKAFTEEELENTAVVRALLVADSAENAPPPPERARSKPLPPDQPSALTVASHVLTLAMACARADGEVQPEEVAAMDSLLEGHLADLSRAEAAQLNALRARLAEGKLAADGAARALSTLLQPGERQLLLEQILGVAAADNAVVEEERGVLAEVARAFDFPPTVLDEMLERRKPAAETAAGGVESERRRWLAALELPADFRTDRLAVERAASRIQDLYAEERFELLAPELQKLAQERRELAVVSLAGLLTELPTPVAAPPPPRSDAAETTVRRDNPDLDSIFG